MNPIFGRILAERKIEVEELISRLMEMAKLNRDNYGFEREVLDAKLTLNSVEDAIFRLKKKTYGLCTDCNQDIPQSFLIKYPEVLFCQSCLRKGP